MANETTYTTTVARVAETAISALVGHDDVRYGVTLSAALCTCSCPHHVWRGAICKHQQMVVDELFARAGAASVQANAQLPAAEHSAAVEAANSAYRAAVHAFEWLRAARTRQPQLRAA